MCYRANKKLAKINLIYLDNTSKSIFVATLTLGSWAKGLQECGTKGKPKRHILYPRECRKVWENEPSHSQVSSYFGSWSLGGLLNHQRAILGVKTHWIEDIFISLESYWNLDVQNGLARPIWTLKTQVMAKRKVGSQIGSLTHDH